MPGKDQRDMKQNGSKSKGDSKSRDGRKEVKSGKGGKVLVDGSLHYDHLNGDEAFDAALDRGDPNYDLDGEAPSIFDKSTSVKLNSGSDMPLVGLGTWQSSPGEVGAAVSAALDCGYKHIDCAACYGNEKEVGDIFEEKFKAGISREEIFVTSKLWNSEHKPSDVRPALMQTLEELKLSYLDLYLIHWCE